MKLTFQMKITDLERWSWKGADKNWQQIVIYKQMGGKIELMQDIDGGMVAWGFIMHPPMIDLFTLAAYCRQLKRF